MATLDKVVDQTPVDQAPIDPNVIVPRHVREAAERAEAFYQQPEPQSQTTPEPAPQPELAPQPEPAPQPEHQPQVQSQLPVPTKDELHDDTWAGRYNSMKGRYDRAQAQIGSLQEQLIQAGDEIGRLNALISRAGVPTAPQENNQPDHNNVITNADRETYGDELLDTVTRVAKGALKPELDALKDENARLKTKAISDGQRDLRQTLARAVPDYMAIQAAPEWKRWLGLPNVYTGVVRGRMLKAAYDAADAPKVVALFQDFIKEVQATGGVVPTNQRQEQQAQPAPRQPAMTLEDLAAPGRAKPAGGNDPTGSAEKPIYTRQQIAANYADRRKGYYNGRETKWAELDADMIAAGREGRIR